MSELKRLYVEYDRLTFYKELITLRCKFSDNTSYATQFYSNDDIKSIANNFIKFGNYILKESSKHDKVQLKVGEHKIEPLEESEFKIEGETENE